MAEMGEGQLWERWAQFWSPEAPIKSLVSPESCTGGYLRTGQTGQRGLPVLAPAFQLLRPPLGSL